MGPGELIPTPSKHSVTINPVYNGFIVKVGCKTLVSKDWKEISDGLAEYWQDPAAAEKKFCK
jgi:hypothetical protein